MTHPVRTTQSVLRRQSVGGVRLVGRHVVWRRGTDEYAVWPERNIYSPVPTGCRYSLKQAIEALTDEEMHP